MESLIVILSLLALSSISSADIKFFCDNSLTCPTEGGIFANCNSTSDVIVWEASLNNDFTGELNFSDITQKNESVIVNGIEVTFVKMGSGVSFVTIPNPNASLNNLELTCTDDANTTDTMSCTLVNFFDSSDLPAPQNLSFNFSSITDDSISYSWNPPAVTHSCSSNVYRVRIRVNGMTDLYDAMVTSAILTEMGEGLNKEHCISVATIGKDNKPGTYTPDECITIDTPTPVVIADPKYNPMYKNEDMDLMRADIIMSWNYVSDSRPPVMRYYVTNNFYPYEGSGSGDEDEPTENPDVTVVVNSTVNQLEFKDVQLGREYTFSVIGENVLGNGSIANTVFRAELPLRPTSTVIVSMTQTASASATPLATPTPSTEGPPLPVWAIAVIAVGGAVVLAIILAVVAIIIFCVCCGAVCAANSKKREEHEMHGTKL